MARETGRLLEVFSPLGEWPNGVCLQSGCPNAVLVRVVSNTDRGKTFVLWLLEEKPAGTNRSWLLLVGRFKFLDVHF